VIPPPEGQPTRREQRRLENAGTLTVEVWPQGVRLFYDPGDTMNVRSDCWLNAEAQAWIAGLLNR
jgi:hypothetical protein